MVEDSGRSFTPRLIEELELTGRQQVHETLTDQMGAFPTGGTAGQGNSAAERLNLANEHELRSCRQVVGRIVELLKEHQPSNWGLAAPGNINRTIVDGLPADARNRLSRNLPLDLTKMPPKEVLERFQQDAV